MKKPIMMTRLENGKRVIVVGNKAYKIKQKALAALTAATLGLVGSYVCIQLDKNNKEELIIKTPDQYERTLEDNSDSDKNMEDESSIKENDNESSENFKILKELESAFGIYYEDINDFVKKYAYYSNYTYEEALQIVYGQKDLIEYEYDNPKAGIMYTLFNSAMKDGRVSDHCEDMSQIKTEYMEFPNSFTDLDEMDKKLSQCSEIEKRLIEMCDLLDINGDDRVIALSIIRVESDYGASFRAVNNNNYGGIVLDGDTCVFSTPEYGMFRTLSIIKNEFLDGARNQGYSDPTAIIYSIAPTFAVADDWAEYVCNQYYKVFDEYNGFSDSNKSLVR